MTVPEMERRRVATQATFDRFIGKPFEWGKHDCARMVAFHLRKIGRPAAVAKAGSYKTAISARAALKRLGYGDLEAWADGTLERRPSVAFALIGDVIAMHPDDPLGSLAVCLGNGCALGWSVEADGAQAFRYFDTKAAWKAI